ncbi:MAG: RES family NAD+ phosphorylase [Candidatus Sulfotelmatobacter sp.]
MKLPAGWRSAIDSLCHDVKPFEDSCFRSVELAWAHPDDVISGEGTKAKGGRFAPKGTRAVYASLDEETATREVTARKARLGGEAQISLKDYPRLTYIVSVGAKRCLDLRKAGDDAVLKQTLKAALDPDDVAASQEVGDYLGAKGIDAIIFPSVVCSGANVVVFRDAGPPPLIEIQNREEILEAIENLAKRITK